MITDFPNADIKIDEDGNKTQLYVPENVDYVSVVSKMINK